MVAWIDGLQRPDLDYKLASLNQKAERQAGVRSVHGKGEELVNP